MRAAIPHSIGQEEARRRIRSRSGEIAGFIPGGMADVTTSWASDDRMDLTVNAMGQHLRGHVEIEETQVVFVVDLPPELSFIEPIMQGALESKGRKLLK